jgi:hypothetical protein
LEAPLKVNLYRERFNKRFKASPVLASSIVGNWSVCSPRKRNTKRERLEAEIKGNSTPSLDNNEEAYMCISNIYKDSKTRRGIEFNPCNIFLTFRADLVDQERDWTTNQLSQLCNILGLAMEGSRETLLKRIIALHDEAVVLLRSDAQSETCNQEAESFQEKCQIEKMTKKRKIVFNPFVQMKTIPGREIYDEVEDTVVIPPTA